MCIIITVQVHIDVAPAAKPKPGANNAEQQQVLYLLPATAGLPAATRFCVTSVFGLPAPPSELLGHGQGLGQQAVATEPHDPTQFCVLASLREPERVMQVLGLRQA